MCNNIYIYTVDGINYATLGAPPPDPGPGLRPPSHWGGSAPPDPPDLASGQNVSPRAQNMSIYRVLHAELIFHGLEALRRDSGPVIKVLV